MTRGQRAVTIGFSLVIAYLLLVGGTPAGMTVPEVRIPSLTLASVVLGGWLFACWRSASWRPRSVFVPLICAAVLAMAVSAALSRSPRIGAEFVAQAVILGSGYLLLVEILRRPQLRARVIFTAAVIGVFASSAYLVEIARLWNHFWDLVGHFTVPPLRPDHASLVYFNPAVMLAIAVLLAATVIGGVPHTRRGTLVAVVGSALAALAALLTGTRAGWLAIAIGVGVVASLAVTSAPIRASIVSTGRALMASWRAKAALALGLVAGLAFIVVVAPGVLRRVDAGGEEVRFSFVLASTGMFAGSPLTGVGPGVWPLQRAINTPPAEVDYFVVDAHNVYLQSLAELGLLGVAVGALGLLTVGWLLRDGLRDSGSARRRWALLATFAIAYLAVHQVFVFFMNIPAVLLAAALPVAMLDATTTSRPTIPIPKLSFGRRAAAAAWGAGAVAVILAIAFAWWTTQAATLASRAARLADMGDWSGADRLAQETLAWGPSVPQYLLLDGLTAARVGDEPRALSGITTFAEFSDLPEAWVDVAALRLRAGDVEGAADALGRGARLGLQHPAVAVAVADLAVRTGDTALAIRAGAAAIAVSPSLAADPWWSNDPGRTAIYPQILAQALERATPDRRWEIKLMSGDVAGAWTEAANHPDPSLAGDVIGGWNGDRVAAEGVFARCASDPLHGPIGWCARLATRLRLAEDAYRYVRLAEMLRIDLDTTRELRIFDSLPQPSVAGGIAYKASGLGRTIGVSELLIPGIARVAPEPPLLPQGGA